MAPAAIPVALLENVKKLVQLRHRHETQHAETRERMAWLRTRVLDELNPELRNDVGRPPEDIVCNTNNKHLQNNASYALRRLKRDAPALAERVLSGELSAQAAAIQAGFRTRKVSIDISSAESAAVADCGQ